MQYLGAIGKYEGQINVGRALLRDPQTRPIPGAISVVVMALSSHLFDVAGLAGSWHKINNLPPAGNRFWRCPASVLSLLTALIFGAFLAR